MNFKFTRLLPGALLTAVCALASPLPGVYVSGAADGAAWNRTPGQPYYCTYSSTASAGSCNDNSTGILVENSSNNLGWYGMANSWTGLASSSGDANGLHASVQLDALGYPLDNITNYNHYGSSFSDSANALAEFYDSLTVQGPGSAPVTVNFGFDVDGSVYRFGNAVATAAVSFNGQSTTVGDSHYQVGNAPLITTQHLSYSLSLTPGIAFSYTLALSVTAGISDTVGSIGPHLSTVDADSNYSNTLKFGTITFTDAAGNPLSGYTLTSSSGYDYNQFVPPANAFATPEPASFGLFAAGSLLAAAARRRLTRCRQVR